MFIHYFSLNSNKKTHRGYDRQCLSPLVLLLFWQFKISYYLIWESDIFPSSPALCIFVSFISYSNICSGTKNMILEFHRIWISILMKFYGRALKIFQVFGFNSCHRLVFRIFTTSLNFTLLCNAGFHLPDFLSIANLSFYSIIYRGVDGLTVSAIRKCCFSMTSILEASDLVCCTLKYCQHQTVFILR